MTTRDLTSDDIDGFLHMHAQCAQETRFAQLEDDWTPCTPLEDVAILLGIFLLVMVVVGGIVLLVLA